MKATLLADLDGETCIQAEDGFECYSTSIEDYLLKAAEKTKDQRNGIIQPLFADIITKSKKYHIAEDLYFKASGEKDLSKIRTTGVIENYEPVVGDCYGKFTTWFFFKEDNNGTTYKIKVENPNGLYFNATPFAETPTPGHWNWPPKVGG